MIRGVHPVLQALLASLFTWGVTALGSAGVFLFKAENKKLLDASLGFAAGVMTAASFWSLLAPAIEISEHNLAHLAFVPVAIGFLFGAAFVFAADRLLVKYGFSNESRVLLGVADNNESGVALTDVAADAIIETAESTFVRKRKKVAAAADGNSPMTTPATELQRDDDVRSALSWRRIVLLIAAITVHNIPEGLAVGVGFGAVGKTPSASFETAFNLALGIGLQNFPEGLAVSLPLAGFGFGRLRAFWYGQLSGMVEPVAALAGASAVLVMEPVLPYALSFAAGAMIFVVFDDIIPEAQVNGNGRLASVTAVAGFVVMMALDVGLG